MFDVQLKRKSQTFEIYSLERINQLVQSMYFQGSDSSDFVPLYPLRSNQISRKIDLSHSGQFASFSGYFSHRTRRAGSRVYRTHYYSYAVVAHLSDKGESHRIYEWAEQIDDEINPRQRVRDFTFTRDDKYFFLATKTTFEKFHILVDPKSGYSSVKDPQYEVEIDPSIFLNEIVVNPSNEFILGSYFEDDGEAASVKKYGFIKFPIDRPQMQKLQVSTEQTQCLREDSFYTEGSFVFKPDESNKFLTSNSGSSLDQLQIGIVLCEWELSDKLTRINKYAPVDFQPKYIENKMDKSYLGFNTHIRSMRIEVIGKNMEPSIILGDDGNAAFHVFAMKQDPWLEYSYSMIFKPYEGTVSAIRYESFYVPRINMKVCYSEKQANIDLVIINETEKAYIYHRVANVQGKAPGEVVEEAFYRKKQQNICLVFQGTMKCYEIRLNCRSQDQYTLLQDCSDDCNANNQYFSSATLQCKQCLSGQCQCPAGQSINHYTGQCKLNCSLGIGAIPNTEFGNNCLCEEDYFLTNLSSSNRLQWSFEKGRCQLVPLNPSKDMRTGANQTDKETVQPFSPPPEELTGSGIPPWSIALIVLSVIALIIVVVLVFLRFYKRKEKLINGYQPGSAQDTARVSVIVVCAVCKNPSTDCEGPCSHKYHFMCIKQRIDDGISECPQCLNQFHSGIQDIKICHQTQADENFTIED